MTSAPTKPSDPAPGEDVFTDEDLVPDSRDVAAERRARRHVIIEKTATIFAVIAYGMVAGGMIALGACAAPFVFQLTPHPWSGKAMGAAFSRFDFIAMTCAVIGLGAEVVRTLLTLKSRASQSWVHRVRRYAAIALALGATYTGMQLSPQIMAMHEEGVRRNVGAEGAELERVHKQAELIGKGVVALALALIALHIGTLPGGGPRSTEGEDDEDVLAPLPPGPGTR